jgi:hypothetical protein
VSFSRNPKAMPLNADNWEVIESSTPPKMVVMPSNNSGLLIGYMAHKYPGRLGWLIGPGGWRRPPSWMPVALDNGAYGAWKKGVPWCPDDWMELLAEAHRYCLPKWAIVPDVVTNREATIESWHRWQPVLAEEYPNLPLAMAVQDGMTPSDVPPEANWIFVGGDDPWKMRSVPMWVEAFPGRVHVGRVNTKKRLWECDRAGVSSVDGTGWLMGGEERLAELDHYLEFTTGQKGHPQMVMESLL